MNPELRELYQEVIIEHGRNPRNFGPLENATHKLQGDNPLCGDKLTLYLCINGQTIDDIGFEGSGCAISMASASLMTEALKGKSIETAKHFFENFHKLLTEDSETSTDTLGKLAVLAGVKEFPVRVKCATLAWHTMIGALQGDNKPISTE
ncbi:MAG: Fe-S cluster assembly sulfur transfer protein SufU [Gammaproteobacteria bacterium]